MYLRVFCYPLTAAGFVLMSANIWLLVPAAAAADETCASCGQQVSVSGDFAHRKDDASVTIEGATNNAAAFREEINGTNFTVTIAHLPAGKYTIVIGEVETLVSSAGRKVVRRDFRRCRAGHEFRHRCHGRRRAKGLLHHRRGRA